MPTTIEMVKQIMDDLIPFNRYLGIRVKELRLGHAVLELPFRDEFVGDPVRRVLHGGVLSTLIDTCGGAAVWTQVELEDRVSTVDLRVDYLRPAPGADLICEGTVQRLGNRVGVVEMRLYTPVNPGRLLATGKGVYNIRRGKVEREAG